MRRYDRILFGLTAAAVIAFLIAIPSLNGGRVPRGPQTLQEAAAIAEELGLYHRSDKADGTLWDRIIVSEIPLSFERASQVCINDPSRPCLAGTVAIYAGWDKLWPNADPACSAVWGELFVYGDPQLIRKLTSAER
jgi:hypothetical protein